MKVDNRRLDILLAQKRISLTRLRGKVSPQTLTKVRRGEDILPMTVGRIAEALEVNVIEIVEQEVYPCSRQ